MEELLKERLELKSQLFAIEKILEGNIEEFLFKVIATDLVIIKDNGWDTLIKKKSIASWKLKDYSVWVDNNQFYIIFDITTTDDMYFSNYMEAPTDLNVNDWIYKQKEYILNNKISRIYEVN